MDGSRLAVVCGPTAAGKSALALALAEASGAIVSADSRQLYRGFRIGTAQPTSAERAAVPHYGVDLLDPAERYSAARFAADATGWIESARAQGREPLVVGGTGFYVRALVSPLFAEPPLDATRREVLSRELAAFDVPTLRRWVETLDPARAHLGRAQLLRAIELPLLSGRRLSALHGASTGPARYVAHYLVVDPGVRLADRIARRVDAMFAAGWVEEVRSLMHTVPDDAPAWDATGYATIRRLVRGEIAERAARERIVTETRQYAKRQRTWFRHQLPADRVLRLDPHAPDAFARAARWWRTADDAAAAPG